MRVESLVRREWIRCVCPCAVYVYIMYIVHECIMKKDFVDIINDITYYYYIYIYRYSYDRVEKNIATGSLEPL